MEVDGDEVGQPTGSDPARLGPTKGVVGGERGPERGDIETATSAARESGMGLEARRLDEPVGEYVLVGADREASTEPMEVRRRRWSVTEILLGARACAEDHVVACERAEFLGRRRVRVHRHELGAEEAGVLEERDRSCAECRLDDLHLQVLLGEVEVPATPCGLRNGDELAGRARAQRMPGELHAMGCALGELFGPREVGIDRCVGEATKDALGRCPLAVVGSLVEVGRVDQGVAAPRGPGGLDEGDAHGVRISIGGAVSCVVKVVKLTNRGVAAEEEFAVDQGCEVSVAIRVEDLGDGQHARSPVPEVSAEAGPTAQGAVERVTVDVREPGHEELDGAVARARSAVLDRGDALAVNLDDHVGGELGR